MRYGQRDNRFQPEYGFTVLACHMGVNALLFIREEVEPISFFSKNGRTHNIQLMPLASKKQQSLKGWIPSLRVKSRIRRRVG